MRFLPRDARSAKRGIAIVSRPSVCLSVRPSVRPFVTLTYRGHIGWTSSKLITRIISLWSSLLGATTSAGNLVQREHPKNSGGIGVGCCFQQKICNISETGQDTTKVIIDDQ